VGRPKGLFTLDDRDPRRPVLVASGTGIAPLRSILEARLATDVPGRGAPVVLHGVADARDLAYRERLEGLHGARRVVYVPTVSRPHEPANAGWHGRTGRVVAHLPSLLDELGVEPVRSVALLCGNAAMTGEVRTALRDWGVPDAAIRVEAWAPPATP
jgi:ferredoxin-NADP reductase